jgi:hypothetical protein
MPIRKLGKSTVKSRNRLKDFVKRFMSRGKNKM